MRLRTLGALVAALSVCGSVILGRLVQRRPISGWIRPRRQRPRPRCAISRPRRTSWSPELAPEPCPQTPPLVGSALPKLSANLEIEVSAYAKDPSSWDVDTWMDSGGPAGRGGSRVRGAHADAPRTRGRPDRRAGAELPRAGIPPRDGRTRGGRPGCSTSSASRTIPRSCLALAVVRG